MKLQTAYIGLLATLSCATAQQCTNKDVIPGKRLDTDGNRVILDRRGKNCPCSYVSGMMHIYIYISNVAIYAIRIE